MKTDERAMSASQSAYSLRFNQLFPDAMTAYRNGSTVYLVQMADRRRAAVFFNKLKGCYLIQYEGQPCEPLLNSKRQVVKTFDELSEALRGKKVLKRMQSREEDMEIR